MTLRKKKKRQVYIEVRYKMYENYFIYKFESLTTIIQ